MQKWIGEGHCSDKADHLAGAEGGGALLDWSWGGIPNSLKLWPVKRV